jgi:hypothetical protein
MRAAEPGAGGVQGFQSHQDGRWVRSTSVGTAAAARNLLFDWA